jgi:hypothetical protein
MSLKSAFPGVSAGYVAGKSEGPQYVFMLLGLCRPQSCRVLTSSHEFGAGIGQITDVMVTKKAHSMA